MTAQPWMKFFPSDWRSDPRLRMCSLAARGLWMEMLMLMHEAEPYGHLLIAGVSPSPDQLAVLAGTFPAEIPALLAELESAAVFSRNAKGVIYSRRMTRDEKKVRLAQKNGQKGGNPSLCKTRPNPPPDKGYVNGGDKTQSPEARIQKEESGGGVDSNPPRGCEPEPPPPPNPPPGKSAEVIPIGRQARELRPCDVGWTVPEEWQAWAMSLNHLSVEIAGRRFKQHWRLRDRRCRAMSLGDLREAWEVWILEDLDRERKNGGGYHGTEADRLRDGLARAFSDCMDTGPAGASGSGLDVTRRHR